MPQKVKKIPEKPNILVIWGDDIGISNLSCYTHGLMGYQTPNIDRLAKEGMIFTDSYAEQSCTAGRASFITGQSGLRTGLTKVGMPGASVAFAFTSTRGPDQVGTKDDQPRTERRRADREGQASANWMTTLMSSGCRR